MIDLARLFSPARNTLAGLDIGRRAVRMVELSRTTTGKLVLRHHASESLVEGVVGEVDIEDLEHVIAATQRLWNKSGCSARKVAIGVPADAITVHNFSVDPSMSTTKDLAQLESLAKEAIAPLLDYDLADACIDFCFTTATASVPGQHHVLVAATRKDIVEDRVAIAESLNLRAVIVDADSYAAHAALARTQAAVQTSADTLALLQLDADGTQLSLRTDGHMVDVVKFDGEPPQHLQSSSIDIEQLACAAARALSVFQSRQPKRQIRQLIASGSRARTPGLIAALQKHSNIVTTIADPFADMSLAAGIDAAQLASEAPAYLVACGLALRRFD